MIKIAEDLMQLTGRTPLLRLNNFSEKEKLKSIIIAKLESFNPASSVKDRVGQAMIFDAEKKGLLKKGSVIIEPTSGNTGIALAFTAASKGYKLILTMPESMSLERRSLLKALGAEIYLTPADQGMEGAINKAKELIKEIPSSFMPEQFSNPANPQAHYETTGPEIWQDLDGQVEFFVAGVGTGGTISGTGKYLKEKNPQVKIIAVEPAESPVLSGGQKGPHKIQGIGAGFIPENYNPSLVDEIIQVESKTAIEHSRLLALSQGLLAGISSGAALAGAAQIAKRKENEGKNIVVLLPDTGERYLSAGLFDFSLDI